MLFAHLKRSRQGSRTPLSKLQGDELILGWRTDPPHMKRLFILSGLPGSGKTYLLNKALSEGVEIFGKTEHARFVEYMSTFIQEDQIRSEDHLYRLKFTGFRYFMNVHGKIEGDVFVYHLDLLSFYFREIFGMRSGPILPISDSSLKDLSDRAKRQEAVSQFFDHHFQCDPDDIRVNLLDVGFERNSDLHSRRKIMRRKVKLGPLWLPYSLLYRPSEFLDRDRHRARKIYSMTIKAWIEDMSHLGIKHMLFTSYDAGQYSVRNSLKNIAP